MKKKGRRACGNCPWRASTAPGAFPGGCVEEEDLRAMSGVSLQVMACHKNEELVCVGFAARVGTESNGYRIALMLGKVDDLAYADEEFLPDSEAVIRKHNTQRNMKA